MTSVNRVLPKGILEQYRKKQLNPKFEKGEYFLADYLDRKLPKEWIIHARPILKKRWGSNINNKTPDIVIAHKSKGIMIIEVKNWDIKKYKTKKTKTKKLRSVWEIYHEDKKGRSGNLNPVLQAENYLWRMRDSIYEILDEIYHNPNKRHLIQCGVYFHNPYSSDLAKKFVGYPEFVNSDRCLVFARDMIDKNVPIEKIIPIVSNRFKIQSDNDWLLKFKNWISPSLHATEGQYKISVNDLDENQKKYVYPRPGITQKLSGVAGSGKTSIVALRAALLAKLSKKVLVICYNITIKNFIHWEVERSNYDFNRENIDYFHFHDFCKAYRENNKLLYPKDSDEEENDDKSVREIIEHKKENHDSEINYDAIIVDEGQDFKKDWFQLLRSFLKEKGEMLIAIDEKQNIYNRPKTKLEGVGGGRWGVLKRSYRLLNNHIKIANKFSETFLKNFEKDKIDNPNIDLNLNKQHTLLFEPKPLAKWEKVNSDSEARQKVYEVLNYLDKEKLDFSDASILVSTHEEGRELKSYIQKKFPNIKIMDIFDKSEIRKRQQKKLFVVSSKKLKMSTIASFKGWDRRNIIILTKKNENQEEMIKNDFEFYTSLTRVREKLFVINQNERYQKFKNENSKYFN